MTGIAEFAKLVDRSGRVDAAQIAELRRAIYSDGIVSRAEAEVLFEIERTRKDHSDAWSDLFVEALTEYVLNREPPTGYLSESTAGWLITELTKRKVPSTDAEIELLINIVETAFEVTPAFSAYALRLVKDMVIYSDGTDARGRSHGGMSVTEADVHSLQRILWGAGSEGRMAVSRDEAEALFAIAHASTGADNVPAFDDLFARAVGNYLLGATGRSVPPREVALRRETEGPYRASMVRVLGSALSSMTKSGSAGGILKTVLDTLDDPLDIAFEKSNFERDVAIDAAEIMTPQKAGWLLDHVGQNGLMTGPEKALVRFVAREASAIDPTLKPLIDKVG